MSLRAWLVIFAWTATGFSITAPVAAQIGPGPFAAFPSPDVTDARMLSFGCEGIATFEQRINMVLAAPPEATEFTLNVFDGETGMDDPQGNDHWDLGDRQLIYSLYFDPMKQGNTAPGDLVGRWYGNADNAVTSTAPNKVWEASAAAMPDNDWWGVTVQIAAPSRAPTGHAFYHLVIETDGSCDASENLASDLKLAASSPMTFLVPRFGFEASLRSPVNTAPIVYPGFDVHNILTMPTTYDGRFTFFLNVEDQDVDLRVYDGDFDHGTQAAAGIPSGAPLSFCADDDDLDTPSDYDAFPFTPVGASPEGDDQPFGAPADDSAGDLFRRGEMNSPERSGCVRYEVTDPNGVVYRNDNPSANLEWEQFRIAAALAEDANSSDYGPGVAADGRTFVASDFLPNGIWKVEVVGLDMSNLNFWYFDTEVCSVRDGEGACPGPSLALGDTVFLDLDENGRQDAGEPGIPGVRVDLYRDLGAPPIRSAWTGDTGMEDFATCQRLNTGLDEAGLYCFGVDDPGAYTAVVAAENFAPGGVLELLYSTTGGEQLSDTLVDSNVLTYDFGYNAGEICAEGTATDPAVHGGSSDHAVWMPGISEDLELDPAGAFLVDPAHGTARLSGLLVDRHDGSRRFRLEATLSGHTSVAPPGSPKKELLASAYVDHGGPVDPATWTYYTGLDATLIGEGDWAGAVIRLVRTGPAFQVGRGANNKNLLDGGSGWFVWTVVQQPNAGSLPASGQGDFNLQWMASCPPPAAPGTGTPGYWKNHPEAWPVDSLTLGGVIYSKDEALAILWTKGRGDKTYGLFRHLVSAYLNREIGNPSDCVDATIAAADQWLTSHPVGSGVRGRSSAWTGSGQVFKNTLDDYNNGLLCAPSRG